MKTKIISFSCASLALIFLGGCEKAEQLRSTEYFQGLGFEKTMDYVKLCRNEKRALLAKKDAEGLDHFAKSTRAANCRTGFKYAINLEAKEVNTKAATLREATTHEALKSLQTKISNDVDTRWEDIPKVFEAWAKSDSSDLDTAFWNLARIASRKSSELNIAAMGQR